MTDASSDRDPLPPALERRPLSELKDRHRDEDAWVLGAAASMDFLDPTFFEGKLVVGVNEVYRRFPCRYLVRKELAGAADAWASGVPLVMSEFDTGDRRGERNHVPGPAWYFDHAHNECRTIDWSVLGTDRLVVSHSTITTAIHFAAYVGARNILVCGHDGGMLDGRLTYRGYYADEAAHAKWYRRWVRGIMAQTRALRDRLAAVYGCRVHSLNPFLGFDLEGHRFET